MTLKSHPILSVNRGFKDSFRSFLPFHGVTSQAWMPEVCIKQAQCLVDFSLYGLGQAFVLLDEPLGILDRHRGLSLRGLA